MKNLKVKALAIMAGWLGAVFAGVAVVQLLAHYFGSEIVMSLFLGAIMLWLLYGVYGLILMKLQWDAKVTELADKHTK